MGISGAYEGLGAFMEDSLEFEREKWRVEVDLRERELRLKEREQANKNADLELRQKQEAASKWRSPLVVAIFTAAAAAVGNAGVTLVNGILQRDLESAKRDAELRIEESKAESGRILEMIKTGNTEGAAKNLAFLLDTALVTDPKRAAKLRQYLDTHGAPVLPPASSRVTFESSPAFTKPVQDRLQKNIDDFGSYLAAVGFPANPAQVRIVVNTYSKTNTAYDRSSNELGIGELILDDVSSALVTYCHHFLNSAHPELPFNNSVSAIQYAFADYFGASFLNNPKVAEVLAKVLNLPKPYVRNLANERTFDEWRNAKRDEQSVWDGAEIWGGALWEMRERAGREMMDSILAQTWMSKKWTKGPDYDASFVAELLSVSGEKLVAEKQAALTEILQKRKFPVAR